MRGTWLNAVVNSVCLLGLVLGADGECSLDTAKYMPFIVRVADSSQAGKGLTMATGNIIAPNTVLTTCVDLKGKEPKDLECQATQGHYQVGKIDDNHFKQADDREDTKGCLEKRGVKTKLEHPRCPVISGKWDEWGDDYTRYNVALLLVTEPFRNYTEAVPTMPFVSDISTQLSMIDTFNTLRTVRCEIPLFNGNQPKIWFQSHMSFRSIALQSECKNQMCKQKHRLCNETVANHTGFVLCAKRVKQREPGIMWNDYFGHDTDLWDGNTCGSMTWVVGAPVICRGSTVGIVTKCQPFGLIISTIYALRIFLNKAVDEGYTEEIIYMDTSDIPTAKDDPDPPKSRSSLYEKNDVNSQWGFSDSNSYLGHQGQFSAGLLLLTVNLIFYVVYTIIVS